MKKRLTYSEVQRVLEAVLHLGDLGDGSDAVQWGLNASGWSPADVEHSLVHLELVGLLLTSGGRIGLTPLGRAHIELKPGVNNLTQAAGKMSRTTWIEQREV